MLRSVARRARVGRPVNVLNFQNRREKPRAAELPCVPRGTKGIAAWRLAPAPWGALLVWGKAASGPPPRSGLTIEGRDAEVLGGCWAVVGGWGSYGCGMWVHGHCYSVDLGWPNRETQSCGMLCCQSPPSTRNGEMHTSRPNLKSPQGTGP